MKQTLLAHVRASALLLAMFQAAAAVAGPLEDGVAAYNKGNFAVALKLLTPLAEGGEADAQYTLALMYQKGEGVTKNAAHSYMWFDVLAKAGDKDAAMDRDQLATSMTPEQLAEGQKLAAEWKPK